MDAIILFFIGVFCTPMGWVGMIVFGMVVKEIINALKGEGHYK
jgi:hypothetical protein